MRRSQTRGRACVAIGAIFNLHGYISIRSTNLFPSHWPDTSSPLPTRVRQNSSVFPLLCHAHLTAAFRLLNRVMTAEGPIFVDNPNTVARPAGRLVNPSGLIDPIRVLLPSRG